MSLTPKKRTSSNYPKGFLVVKKKKSSPSETDNTNTKSSLEKKHQLLQENFKETQSQLDTINTEKVSLLEKYETLSESYQILQRNNMKLESLNKACLTLLFQSCQHEEQLTQVRSLIEKSTNTNYENYLKYNMNHFMNQLPETQQSEVIKALEVIEKY